MAKTVFNRYEKKYIIPESIYAEFIRRLSEKMTQDKYGLHTICNIYYDTPDYLLIRRSMEHHTYKEKLRLRSYGIPDKNSVVFLEIKKKYRRIVNKRRVSMTLSSAYKYTGEKHDIKQESGNLILDEINFFLNRYNLRKSMYIAYDRIAFFGNDDSDFRVTIDTNIRYRMENMELEKGDYGTKLLPDGYYLMECKFLGAAPLWFSQLLADMKLYTTSFSKYGNIYKKINGQFDFEKTMTNYKNNWEKGACEQYVG